MKSLFLFGIAVAAAAWPLYAQGSAPERITVPLTDPARPVTLTAHLVSGSIRVKAYNGKEVIVEARSRGRESKPETPRQDGLKRINVGGTGLEVEEENNSVKVNAGPPMHPVDLDIQVPVSTSVKVETVNDGEIVVEGVKGDQEASNINGAVTLTGISGSAVVHALNGRMKVVFAQVDPQKSMSFSSLNGEIDVTFPASLKANVKIKTMHGEVFSDFDLKPAAPPKPAMEDSTSGKGKFRLKLDQTLNATINGGGPEIQFNNLNGAIMVRKAGQ